MSFADVLNSYCTSLNCTNAALAEQCGISASALSRYRNGSRIPKSTETVRQLARGIVSLSQGLPEVPLLSIDDVETALETAQKGPQLVGMSFGDRLNLLMNKLGISNVYMARLAKVDPSYLSRIRSGQRVPADRDSIAILCARVASYWSILNDKVAILPTFIGELDEAAFDAGSGLDLQASLADDIAFWLMGSDIVETDIDMVESLLDWLNTCDFAAIVEELACPLDMPLVDLSPRAGFHYGAEEMQRVELEFLDIAAYARSKDVFMSSDMPLLEMELEQGFYRRFMRGVGQVIRRGGHVNIVHSIDRPLEETVQALRRWIPVYLSGRVTPYYLRGMVNRLFCHANYICDTCALSCEAVMGHQSEGRYYLSLLPDDLAYYQRKMEFILEKASSLLEIYLEDVPGDFERFEQAERLRAQGDGREVRPGAYENLRVMFYPADCAVISLLRKPAAHLVLRHPKLRYAFSVM
ncbi:MAG TPA: hypothetical protein DCP91_08365 [Eggerthellaceae bacterium]|nr:hypothetical protein [Eggerthellaceae bacterium]